MGDTTGSRLAKNIWTLSASRVLYRLASVGVTMYLARALGAAELGQYATVMSVVTLFLAFGDLGVSNLVIRDVSRDRSLAFSYLDSFFFLQIATGIALSACIVLTGVLSSYEPLVIGALALGALGPFFSGMANAYNAVLSAHERLDTFAWIEIAAMLAFVFGNLAVVLLGGGVLALVGVTAAVSAISLALGAWRAARFGMRVHARVDRTLIATLVVSGAPFLLINGLHFAVQRLDILFLSWHAESGRIGVYAAASRLVFASLFFLNAAGAALYPVMSRLCASDRNRAADVYRDANHSLFLAGALTGLVFFHAAPLLVPLLYGGGFEESVAVLQILSLFLPFYAYDILGANVLMVGGAVWNAVGATAAALLVTVVLLAILVPLSDVRGAAAAVVAGELTARAAYAWEARRKTGFRSDHRRDALTALAFAAGMTLPLLIDHAWAALRLAAGVAVFIALAFAVRAVSVADLRRMRLALRGEAS